MQTCLMPPSATSTNGVVRCLCWDCSRRLPVLHHDYNSPWIAGFVDDGEYLPSVGERVFVVDFDGDFGRQCVVKEIVEDLLPPGRSAHKWLVRCSAEGPYVYAKGSASGPILPAWAS